MAKIDSIDNNRLIKAAKVSSIQPETASIPFADIFNQALEVDNQNQSKGIEYNLNQKLPISIEERELLAQALNPDEIESIYNDLRRRKRKQDDNEDAVPKLGGLGTERLEVTPFQLFIDKAIEVLESISDLDFKVNNLTEKYVRGEASIDEVSVEMTKLNLAVSFATTLLSSATGAFKEITQIAI